VPDLTIKRIPDGSHCVIHEQPELLNKYIKEFIKEDRALEIKIILSLIK
jgi:pimeloyl-ACP methyl ester carboxylesterase